MLSELLNPWRLELVIAVITPVGLLIGWFAKDFLDWKPEHNAVLEAYENAAKIAERCSTGKEAAVGIREIMGLY